MLLMFSTQQRWQATTRICLATFKTTLNSWTKWTAVEWNIWTAVSLIRCVFVWLQIFLSTEEVGGLQKKMVICTGAVLRCICENFLMWFLFFPIRCRSSLLNLLVTQTMSMKQWRKLRLLLVLQSHSHACVQALKVPASQIHTDRSALTCTVDTQNPSACLT